jgi:hypothetical protein
MPLQFGFAVKARYKKSVRDKQKQERETMRDEREKDETESERKT